MPGRRPSSRPPAAPPVNADEGAEAIRLFVLKLFHRPDGDAADWELIASSLFKAGLHAIDKMPQERKRAFADRLSIRAYEKAEAAKELDDAASRPAAPATPLPPPHSEVFKSMAGPPPPRGR